MEIFGKNIGDGVYYTAFPLVDKVSIYVSVNHWEPGKSLEGNNHRAALIKNDERGRKLAFELLELCAEYLWKNGEKTLNDKKILTVEALPTML